MLCLGLEPGAAGWKAITNPLSYCGTPSVQLSLGSAASVIRFGEISPFWPKFELIWQHIMCLFRIWDNFKSTFVNLVLWG